MINRGIHMSTVLSKCFELAKWTVGLTLSAALVACGGSGGGSSAPPVRVANANVVVPITATTVPALVPAAGAAPIVATFPNGFSGVNAAGAPVTVTGATTVAFTNTGGATPGLGGGTPPGFSITNGGSTASGTVTFGSCTFTVTASNFPATSPLAVGKVIKVDPCTMTVNTIGDFSNGTTNTDSVTLTFGTSTSAAFSLPVTIDGNGTVSVNGVVIGTVPLSPITGATGAGG